MQKILEDYSELFDFYLEKETLPEYCQSDVMAHYLKDMLDDPSNRHLCTTDPIWRDLLKNSLLDFFRRLLPYIRNLEEEEAKEKKYMRNFHRATLNNKRTMWENIVRYISNQYPPSKVNLNGYVRLMKDKTTSKESIFDALIKDWEKACEERIAQNKKDLLEKYKNGFEEWVQQVGKEDYRTIQKTNDIFYKYPLLKEIIEMMGREKEKHSEEEDSTITRHIPLLLAHSKSKEEIEGIRMGDELNALVPTEVTWLSEPKTELLFFQKFASKQLQLFASKPPTIQHKKTEHKQQKKPRLQEGPMIVCVDTSASMGGKPQRIAKSMVMQLLQTAKRKKRKCYLITFAVRAKILDISRPEHWSKVKLFMQDVFTGGTDGEEMLKAALKALQTEQYSMADVLVISDFEFGLPLSKTKKQIEEEQNKGVRFYGLQIGQINYGYEKVLDKIWIIQ